MHKYLFFLLLAFLPFVQQSCSNRCQPEGTILPAAAFSEKMKACPDGVLLDVRTPEEFAKGHLPNALNINWTSADFAKDITTLDKSKPVFIYCLSGARSADAAEKMRADGFQTVVELQGGIMKWRTAALPETKDDPNRTAGMSQAAFDNLVKTDKLVLIDFYADWCAPCKKMAPYLEEIKNEMADQVNVVRINADDNQFIVQQLRLDALPVLLIYKNGVPVWKNVGFIEKSAVVAQLEAQ